MDNLRDYGEDNAVSSTGLGRSLAKLPSSSEGDPAPTSSQAIVMAASTPATTLVTSGPVPAVSAPTTPASSMPKDSTVALDDLPPPPPPAEPYEVFLARVSRELSSLPIRSAQPGVTVPPRPVVATPTTGSWLPMPFARYEDSSWAPQPQAPSVRIRMPLPASCYLPPPSPWVWPGRGPAVAVTMVRGPPPTTPPTGPPGLPGPSSRTSSCRTCSCSSSVYAFYWSQKHLSYPTALSRIFSGGHAPFYLYCAIVQCEQCCSSADATRRWDPLPGTYPGDG